MSGFDLPKELLIEILSRLPVESLLRCKAVCKLWLSLILNPRFINTHLHRTAINPKNQSFIAHCYQANLLPNHMIYLLYLNSLENPINLQHPFPDSIGPSDIEVVGSCNGLLCVTNKLDRICLWNPATRQVKDISDFNVEVLDSTGEVSIGFGFDEVMNDYKVVRVVYPSRSKSSPGRVEVHSVNEGFWRVIEVELDFELIQGSCRMIVKGNPYWLGLRHRWEHKGVCFVSFDVHNELFETISFPEVCVVDQERGFRSITEFKDSIAIIVGYWDEARNLKLSLWAMDDDCSGKSSWTKKFTLGPVWGMDRLVSLLKNGEIVAEKVHMRELFLYDPLNEETKQTQVQMRTLEVYDYMESLIRF